MENFAYNVPRSIVKSLYNTHYENQIKSIKVIRFQGPQIILTLLEELHKSRDNVKLKSEVENLYKDEGFTSSIDVSKSIALDMVVVNVAFTSLKNTFEQLKTFESIFEFFFQLDDNELRKCCANVHFTLSHDNVLNISLNDYFSELRLLQMTSQ
ncbi:hypothetical protein CR513_37932, partial [Mucuna pruriens]